MKRTLSLALATVILGASGCSETATSPLPKASAMSAASRLGDALPGQYIVVLKATPEDAKPHSARVAAAHGATPRHLYSRAVRGFSATLSDTQVKALSADPQVAYVVADHMVHIAATQTGATWGIDRIDQASLPLDQTYTYSMTGKGVNVYIIDTGILSTHVELYPRVREDFTSINDSYGPTGCHWHGTHVSGTAGGTTVGVAKAVILHSVRVLDCTGSGPNSGVVAGIDWVIANAIKPAVINMSLGDVYDQPMNDATEAAVAAGIPVVVAAGNSSADACGYSPASAPGAITAGATTSSDAQASFSNFGNCVDVFAPGYLVYSAFGSSNTAMGLASGTSMAAPHVTGAVALYLQIHPDATPAEVAAAIKADATPYILTSLGSGSPNLLLRVNKAPFLLDSPPKALFTGTCSKHRSCNFNASLSSDDNGIISYTWSFGDGTSGTGVNPSHKYPQAGAYTVTLLVTDTAEQTATASAGFVAKK